ncbi:MAG: filamentous hemagglutinin N-terminal domain-containing protein [Rhizonema sp. PD37]|nr:filamentous hemagglutinin N-terminal domain-containing protein [Rhizonema sp. PD37]
MTIRQSWIQLLTMISVLMLNGTPISAQITPDNTLRVENSRLTPNVLIKGANADRIDGGAQRGSNLFHSFIQFNIGDGQRVYFGNPLGVQNILTRVTGGQASNIFGTLGVDGAANLFLINPNGILFGKNASLDIRGSFVGTTANAVQFGNQGIFSATNPEAPPLLTINPSALLFNQIQANAGITNRSQAPAGVNPNGDNITGLRVPDGKSLLLAGGNVYLEGGGIRAYSGRVELTGLSAPGSIGLNVAGDTISSSIPNNAARADVSLTNEAIISVLGTGGGDIAINARNLEISNSSLAAGIGQNLGNTTTQAGDINLNATGSISLKDGTQLDNTTYGRGNAGNVFIQASNAVSIANSSIYSNVDGVAVGNAGNISIKSGTFSLTDGAILDASTIGQGNAGNVFIQTSDSVSLVNSNINSAIEAGAMGNGGNINIQAGSLSLTDSSQLLTVISAANGNLPIGRGNGGDINIDVRGTVTFAKARPDILNGISSQVNTGAHGNGGNVNINANSLEVTDRSEIQASTRGKGNSGNITINARDTVSFDGGDTNNGVYSPSRAINTVQPGAEGKAGDIRITTNLLSLTNGGYLRSSTNGKGDAGNITIDAHDAVSFDRGGFADVSSSGKGKGGDIRITTGSLSLTNGGQLASNISGQGDAGNIIIDARDRVKLDGVLDDAISGIQSSLLNGGIGKGGNISLTTGSLSVTNGAALTTSSDGLGNAGDISINARDIVTFEGRANDEFPSRADSSLGKNGIGNGGLIRVNARALFLKNGGQITAESFGHGDAGKIIIDSHEMFAIDGISRTNGLESVVSTTGNPGNGGDIQVTTGTLSITNGGMLFSTAQGNAGNITIDARDAVNFDGVASAGSVELSSGVSSELLSGGSGGKGGNIRVTTNSLSLTNGAQLNSSTAGNGNAGDITIDAHDVININGIGSNQSNTGVYSTVQPHATGKGGNINVNGPTLSINRGGISSSSFGQGQAGDINVNSGSVRLDNTAVIAAITNSGNGGNLSLTAQDFLLLRHGSQVSTKAGNDQAGGDGGNITISTPFIIALPSENSNISADAFTGRGGNVNISTQSILGIKARPRQTAESDITASSERGVQGQIFIAQPDIQPSQGVVELPTQIFDASRQITQTCANAIANNRLGKFIVSGRGGSLPPNPIEPIAGTTSIPPLATLDGESNVMSSPVEDSSLRLTHRQGDTAMHRNFYHQQLNPTAIVAAQGWVKTADGTILLIGQVPQATPSTATTSATCPVPKGKV